MADQSEDTVDPGLGDLGELESIGSIDELEVLSFDDTISDEPSRFSIKDEFKAYFTHKPTPEEALCASVISSVLYYGFSKGMEALKNRKGQ